MTLQIQLAVQGGGAKLCGLLAALDAVQRLEATRVIKVTRIAGTSSGAIAAALYAANVNLSQLRTRILDNHVKLGRMVPQPGMWRLTRAVSGRPMVNLAPIRGALKSVLQKSGVETFKDLPIPLHVVATNLTDGRAHVYSSGKDDDVSVTTAVLDSAAIPFYLRGPGSPNGGTLLVDGGICENFPVDVLDSDEKKNGIITGITFSTVGSGESPEGVLSFAVSLLDAAMANSVRRAQRALTKDRMLTLDAKPSTLDFGWALSEGMADAYDLTLNKADAHFRRLAAPPAEVPTEIQTIPTRLVDEEVELDSLDTLHAHAELFRAQHAHVQVEYHDVRMLARAGGSLTGGHEPDFLEYQMRFSAYKHPLECVRINVTGETPYKFLKTLRTEVYDQQLKRRDTVSLRARDLEKPDNRSYLLFFSPAIPVEDPGGPFLLQYSHELRAMFSELRTKRIDTLALSTNRAGTTTPRLRLVAVIPVSHPGYYLKASAKTTGANPGRPMSPEEVNAVVLELALNPAFYALGWVGTNIARGTVFAADICAAGH